MPAPWLFRLLCLYPLAWGLAFVGFVLRARVALGRWPAPNRPDPADLGFGVHHMALLLGEPGLFVLLFVLLLMVGLLRRSPGGCRTARGFGSRHISSSPSP